MTDWFHKTLKAISYNRYAVLGLLLGASFFAAVTGCQITATSPFDGQPATADEIRAQAEDYDLSAQQAEKLAFAQYQATVDKIKADAEQKGREVGRAIADIQRKQENIGAVAAVFQDLGEIIGGPTGSGIILGTGVLMNLFGGGALIDAARRKQLLNSIVKGDGTTPTA